MRPIIIMGATESIKDAVHVRYADSGNQIHYAEGPEQALDLLEESPHAVLAYGPDVFGKAATRQACRIYTDEPQLLVTDKVMWNVKDDTGSDLDPVRLLEGAALALRVSLVLDLSQEMALEVLGRIMASEDYWPTAVQA